MRMVPLEMEGGTYSVWSIASFPGLTWFGASVVVASVVGSLSLLRRDHFV
jgi:hypothetical protein